MSVEQTHEEKETLTVDVLLPGHEARVTTALFERTKKQLMLREDSRCWCCGEPAEDVGPLEAHHRPVERSLAMAWDWPRFAADCKAGMWGVHAQAFDWDAFLAAKPFDPYTFVDDMTVNGMLLCKREHIGKGAGIHAEPEPLFIWRRYAPDGYEITPGEHLKHDFT